MENRKGGWRREWKENRERELWLLCKIDKKFKIKKKGKYNYTIK